MSKLIVSRILGYQGDYEYDFPNPTINLETHGYNEETDEETDEIDWVLVQMNFDDAMEEARNVAEKFNITFASEDRGRIYRSNSYAPFVAVFQDNDGYDSELGISVYDNPDFYPYEDDDGNITISSQIAMDDWYENFCDFVDYLCDGTKGDWLWSV